MTKKTQTPEVTAVEQTDVPTTAAEPTDQWTRQTSVNFAIDHHRINGGMLTPAQLIDNAKQFHAYITGETK